MRIHINKLYEIKIGAPTMAKSLIFSRPTPLPGNGPVGNEKLEILAKL